MGFYVLGFRCLCCVVLAVCFVLFVGFRFLVFGFWCLVFGFWFLVLGFIFGAGVSNTGLYLGTRILGRTLFRYALRVLVTTRAKLLAYKI